MTPATAFTLMGATADSLPPQPETIRACWRRRPAMPRLACIVSRTVAVCPGRRFGSLKLATPEPKLARGELRTSEKPLGSRSRSSTERARWEPTLRTLIRHVTSWPAIMVRGPAIRARKDGVTHVAIATVAGGAGGGVGGVGTGVEAIPACGAGSGGGGPELAVGWLNGGVAGGAGDGGIVGATVGGGV
jgi:hypothetical protein